MMFYKMLNRIASATSKTKHSLQMMTIRGVLSIEETHKLINAPKNIKHKAILYTIYSAGLRNSELINLTQLGYFKQKVEV